MKKQLILLSLFAADIALVSGSAQAAMTVLPGDLLMGFYQVNSSGTGVTSSTYVYNLGAGSSYREDAAGRGAIGNVNDDLTSAFGGGWASDGNVRMGIVGVVGSTDPTTSGDPARTTYFSQGIAAVPGDSSGLTLSSSQRGTLSTALKTFTLAMDGAAENGATDGGILYSSGDPSSFASFLPPVQTTYFGIGASPTISMTGDTVGLDVYRTLHSTGGADLTSAFSTGEAERGLGQYVGSFTLSSAGDIAFTPVPEPSTALMVVVGAFLLARRRRG